MNKLSTNCHTRHTHNIIGKYGWMTIQLYVFTLAAMPIHATTWTIANCTNRGGKIITTESGTDFCVSNSGSINYWSAKAWCQAHGGKLATAQSVCQISSFYADASCPNLKCTNLWRNALWLDTITGTDGKNWLLSCEAESNTAVFKSLGRSALKESWRATRPICE